MRPIYPDSPHSLCKYSSLFSYQEPWSHPAFDCCTNFTATNKSNKLVLFSPSAYSRACLIITNPLAQIMSGFPTVTEYRARRVDSRIFIAWGLPQKLPWGMRFGHLTFVNLRNVLHRHFPCIAKHFPYFYNYFISSFFQHFLPCGWFIFSNVIWHCIQCLGHHCNGRIGWNFQLQVWLNKWQCKLLLYSYLSCVGQDSR